jgi:hypothetical protein
VTDVVGKWRVGTNNKIYGIMQVPNSKTHGTGILQATFAVLQCCVTIKRAVNRNLHMITFCVL